ncbi:type II toxin-antitoxin system VapC family toxin [Variovorax sp. J22R24]|uniref:type II toxin-antitoxin system VapC family toxin n=1 Tax=Variovorax gracilis TaxID=3053502 RepID=UPI002577EC52|nr:type II toxin-antitoxin system VapC family toxin [Variovorax sp. J22R24]MDM0109116.1 type II toxin-antitoxin system VapC family toxin [Variovorax sp. J22R24]
MAGTPLKNPVRKPRRKAVKAESLWGGLHDGDLVVVDSAPLIYLLDDHPDFAPAFEGVFALQAQGVIQIAISTVAMAEVLAGPFRHRQDVLAKRYEKALSGFDVVPISQEISVTAARIRASAGLRLPDALQAATALETGAVALVTHDRDFSRLADLRVILGDTGPTQARTRCPASR